MKYAFSICLFFLVLVVQAQKENPNYDLELAKELGADDYGMKTYVFVLLQSGENTSENEEARNEAFAGHMANIGQLVEEDKLIVAGPMLQNNKDWRGIFILNVDNLEEAEKMMSTDPAIAAGYLKPEMALWYGSAALAEYLYASDKIWKISP